MQYEKTVHNINKGNLEFKRTVPPDIMLRGTMVYISKDNKLLKAYPENIQNYIRPFNLSESFKKE